MLIALLKLFYVVKIKRKTFFKLYTKILFHCLNINPDSPLSSNDIKLEEYQLQNLSFSQCSCFAAWQV